MKLPVLIGGTREGEIVAKEHKIDGRWWPHFLYLRARITLAEEQKLNIDNVISWRNPDDVYAFDGTNYVFKQRIDYKPR